MIMITIIIIIIIIFIIIIIIIIIIIMSSWFTKKLGHGRRKGILGTYVPFKIIEKDILSYIFGYVLEKKKRLDIS